MEKIVPIYNTIEIRKLHSQLNKVEQNIDFIAHKLAEDVNSISRLSDSVEKLRNYCTKLLSSFEIYTMKTGRLLIDLSVITKHNFQIIEWGRGADALLLGSIHPAIVNSTLLVNSLKILKVKAEKKGLKLLPENMTSTFKLPMSFITTQDGMFTVIVHIPLIETNPIDIFEYLPAPISFGAEGLTLTIDSALSKTILIIDRDGNQGLELSVQELAKCEIEKTHVGNLYMCPEANLIRNNIKNSCLGSLMFGNQKLIKSQCRHILEAEEKDQDFAFQISSDTVLMRIKENDAVHEICEGGIRRDLGIVGLHTFKVSQGCKLLTEDRPSI